MTYWGVGHVCVRTECFVRKWFSFEPRCKDTTFGFVHHTFLYVSCDSRTFLLWNVCMPMNNLASQGGNQFVWSWHQGDGYVPKSISMVARTHKWVRFLCFVWKVEIIGTRESHSIFDIFMDKNAQKVGFQSGICGFGLLIFLMLYESLLLYGSMQVVENKPFRRIVFISKNINISYISYFLKGTYFTPHLYCYIYIIDY